VFSRLATAFLERTVLSASICQSSKVLEDELTTKGVALLIRPSRRKTCFEDYAFSSGRHACLCGV
jgi:hypothetical protein